MDICKMCAHRIPNESDFKCDCKCDEYMEFKALPVYEAAPDMRHALSSIVRYLGASTESWALPIIEVALKALEKAGGREE